MINEKFEYKNHFHDNDHIASRLIMGNEDAMVEPLVSVIMPVYNHPDFFRRSLLSVINQKCEFNYEIIIVDNGHPEFQPRNEKIVDELMCSKINYYVNDVNIGGIGSENRGVQLAKGEYISFCHDDDVFYDDTLKVLIDVSSSIGDKCAAIYGNYMMLNDKDDVSSSHNDWESILMYNVDLYKLTKFDLMARNYTNGCGALYSKKCFIEIGGFNPDYIPCPDYALNICYALNYGAYAVRHATFMYRISDQSDSSSVYMEVVKADKKIRIKLSGTIYANKMQLMDKIFNIMEKCEEYNQCKQWSPSKPLFKNYFFYRIVNRIIYYFVILIRRYNMLVCKK